MKINYKNPRTGKPSSVSIPNVWVVPYEMALGYSSPGDYPWPDFVQSEADFYFLDFDFDSDPPGSSPITFTGYCEAVMALRIRGALSHLRHIGSAPSAPENL
jgi:hypothetical protein